MYLYTHACIQVDIHFSICRFVLSFILRTRSLKQPSKAGCETVRRDCDTALMLWLALGIWWLAAVGCVCVCLILHSQACFESYTH